MSAIKIFQSIVPDRIPAGSSPWSIAELDLSDNDYERLVEAFAEITALDWEVFQHGLQDKRDHSRLFLVTVFAEHARRHTRGDQIWSCMKKLRMRNCLRDHLFLSNGQPSRSLRDAIESAAYRWNLRHVFDIPDHQAWYVTLFLQFGFPLSAAQKRLPFWLSGQILPVSVSYLIEGGMQSPSFVQAWQFLKAYRRRQVSEDRCLGVLRRSPWIPSDWIPKLLTLARSRLHLIDLGIEDETEESEPLILDNPSLIWPGNGDPSFECEAVAAVTFELEAASYEVSIKDLEPVRLLRQDDASYYPVGDAKLTIPLQQANVQCTLTAIGSGTGSEAVASQSITLWDRAFPVSLYRKCNGQRMLDPEKPQRLDQGCYAIFHKSFIIEPEPLRLVDKGSWRVAELPACELNDLALFQDGERVWWPEEEAAGSAQEDRYPVSILPRHVGQLEWTKPDQPPRAEFTIQLPEGAGLRWVRFGHEVVETDSLGGCRYRTLPFALRPEHAVHPFYATVGFHADGRSHRVIKRLKLNLSACFLEHEGQLSIYEPHRALNTRNARRFLFHVLRPDQAVENSRRNWILEGNRVVRSVSGRALSLTNLAGYGEPLQLLHGLYNTERNPEELCCRVRDNGNVQKVMFNEYGVTLLTTSPLELGSKHELIAWTRDHRFVSFPASWFEPGEYPNTWFCDLTDLKDEHGQIPLVSAIGFFYDGGWLGNWFHKKFRFTVTQVASSEQAICCAEMLRWFKAPVLDPEVGSAMRFLLKRFLGDVMRTWLSSSPSQELNLDERPVDEEWLRVVSKLCRSTSLGDLTLAEASQVVEEAYPEFDPGKLAESLPLALEALEGVGANLIAKIAHLYLAEIRAGSLRGDEHAVKVAILNRFAVGNEELDNLSEKLQIDPKFVHHAIGQMVNNAGGLSERDQRNHEILLNHRLIRRLLAHRYLSCL